MEVEWACCELFTFPVNSSKAEERIKKEQEQVKLNEYRRRYRIYLYMRMSFGNVDDDSSGGGDSGNSDEKVWIFWWVRFSSGGGALKSNYRNKWFWVWHQHVFSMNDSIECSKLKPQTPVPEVNWRQMKKGSGRKKSISPAFSSGA